MTEPSPPSPDEPDVPKGILATRGSHAAAERYDLSTEIAFVDRPSTSGNRDQYLSSSPPIYQTATFKQITVSDPGEYEYTRSSNPTRSALGTIPTVTCKLILQNDTLPRLWMPKEHWW
jgi:hypothetical protein